MSGVDSRAKELISIGDGLFAKKMPILSLWQALNEQFYPEAADYTYTRSIGMEFASHLMTGIPAMASRDLATAISAMLRPPGQPWFHVRTSSEAVNRDSDALRWLDFATERMRLAMYDNRSGWNRASKEADRDFVVIGNACISLRPNENANGLLYRTKHMRDVAWAEDHAGMINEIHVKDKLSVRNYVRLFPKKAPQPVKDAYEKDPMQELTIRHIVLPTNEYDGVITPRVNRKKLPFTSIWVDIDNEVILEEKQEYLLGYIPPRWETKPGFGYGYSPPSTINIADARMLQQITLTLLEAGQKSVDPPYKAVGEMIQGGVNLFAGGITWVDADYDERTGAALEPLLTNNPNLGWGVDREKRIAEIIAQGHFLNQIKLPDASHARTAFEVEKMWQEFIRTTTPLFEPIQSEYNGSACDQTFELMLRLNGFGPIAEQMPPILRGQSIKFDFESPLTMARERADVQAFTAVGQVTQLGVQMDPMIVHDLNVDVAYRDAIRGTGARANWLVPKPLADQAKAQARQQAAQQQAQQAQMQQLSQGADVGAKIGQAATMLQQGGIIPPNPPQNGGAI